MHLGYNLGWLSIFLGGTWIHRVLAIFDITSTGRKPIESQVMEDAFTLLGLEFE